MLRDSNAMHFTHRYIEVVSGSPSMLSKRPKGVSLIDKKSQFVFFPQFHQLWQGADVTGVDVQTFNDQKPTCGAGLLWILKQ